VIVIGQVEVQIVVATMEVFVGQFVVCKGAIAVGRLVELLVALPMEVLVGGYAVVATAHLVHQVHRRRRRLLEVILMLFVQRQVI
jgi:hypothetical protein